MKTWNPNDKERDTKLNIFAINFATSLDVKSCNYYGMEEIRKVYNFLRFCIITTCSLDMYFKEEFRQDKQTN